MESSGDSSAVLTVMVGIGCVRTTLALATIETTQAIVMSSLLENRLSNNPEVIPVHHYAITSEQCRCMCERGCQPRLGHDCTGDWR